MLLRLLPVLAGLGSSAGLLAGGGQAPLGIDRIAVDARGRVFAFNKDWSDKLAVFEKGSWREIFLSPARSPAHSRGMLGLRDGRMASLWHVDDDKWVLAMIEGDRLVQKARFSWKHERADFPEMMADSTGRIWVSGAASEIVYWEPASDTLRKYDLAPFRKGPADGDWSMVSLTEDLQGGIWPWCSERNRYRTALREALRIRNGSPEPLPEISVLKGRRSVSIRPRDKDSLWICNGAQGLFVLDVRNLTVQPVPPPEKGAFSSLNDIFPFGKGWLVCNGMGSQMNFWEFQEGKWTQRRPVGSGTNDWSHLALVYLQVKSGALLSMGQGTLFFPYDGEGAIRLDWRNGWALGGPEQLLSLGGDRFAALSRGGMSAGFVVADLQQYLAKQPRSEIVEIDPWQGWAVDSQDRVFTMLEPSPTKLSVWENGSWRKISLPENLKKDELEHIAVDAKDRVWVFCGAVDRPVGILFPDLQTWETPPDFLTALVKYREDLGHFAKDFWWLCPIMGPRGQIAFRTRNWQIAHWDGRLWRTWPIQEIGAFEKQDRVSTPFFDEQGALCVNTLRSDKTWKLGQDQKWKAEPKAPGIPDMWTDNKSRPIDRTLPGGFSRRDLGESYWVATDNLGATWVVGNRNLYKSYQGHTASLFDAKAIHPFVTNPQISSVRVDRFGNAWFQVGPYSARHIFLPGEKQRPPELSLSADRWGWAVIDSSPGDFVEWRLDGGKWQTLRSGKKSLGFLPSGSHVVEFRVFTDRLVPLAPVTRKVFVETSPGEQLEHFVQILETGPDVMREAAIAGLVRNSGQAVPVLREASKRSGSWWLEAALQECERAKGEL